MYIYIYIYYYCYYYCYCYYFPIAIAVLLVCDWLFCLLRLLRFLLIFMKWLLVLLIFVNTLLLLIAIVLIVFFLRQAWAPDCHQHWSCCWGWSNRDRCFEFGFASFHGRLPWWIARGQVHQVGSGSVGRKAGFQNHELVPWGVHHHWWCGGHPVIGKWIIERRYVLYNCLLSIDYIIWWLGYWIIGFWFLIM